MSNSITISDAYRQWKEIVQKDLKGGDFDEKLVHTVDGIKIQPLYTVEDIPPTVLEEDDEEDVSWMQDGNDGDGQIISWNVGANLKINDGDNFEFLLVEALNSGAHYIRLEVENDAQWDGICNQLKRMQFPVQFSFVVNSNLQEENVASKWRNRVGMMGDRDRMLQSIEFDPIGYWSKNGSSEEPGKSFNALADIFLRISGHLQDCKLITIDATAFAQAGDNAIEQIAKTLFTTTEYFHQLSKRNIPVEEMMQLLYFRFSVGEQYFMEIAKLRAFKIVWRNLIKAWLPDYDMIPEPFIYCETLLPTHPENKHSNLLRTTTAAMSAILGGCEVLAVGPYDDTDEQAKHLAINIQNLLRYESYMDKYRHAADGSFFIENLSVEIAEKSWNRFKELN